MKQNLVAKIVLGKHQITSILGIIAGALVMLQQFFTSGETDWKKIALAIAIYVLGRVAADANGGITPPSNGYK